MLDRRFKTRFWVSTVILCLFSANSLAVTWQNSVEISNNEVTKAMHVYGASDGGAHIKWNADGIKYRRVYANGSWGPIQTVRPPGNNILANGDIIEAGDGSIWVSWEDWPDGLECAAAQSTNGGANWTIHYLGAEKFPELARVGETGSRIMCSAWFASPNEMDYWLWNGSSWSGMMYMVGANAEYWVTGSAWSPYDGRVWRTYGNDYSGGTHLYVKAFDDDTNTWGSATRMTDTAGFFAWPAVAANEYGQVCVVWERDELVYMRFYDPSTGWGPVKGVDGGRLSAITRIPGKKKFYLTYTTLPSHDSIKGRVIEDGNVGSADHVSAGVPNDFTVDSDVSADANGRLHCVFEYWGDGRPETFYSYTDDLAGPDPEPYLQNTYVSEPMLTADGTTEYQVTLEAGDGNGGNDLHDMRILFNYDPGNSSEADARGYLIWGLTEADVHKYDSTLPIMGSATGGGYWSIDDDGWGYQYITPTGCSTTVNGAVRNVTWTIKVEPAWGYEGPQSGNLIGMFVRDSTDLLVNWTDSVDEFGYTFNVQPDPIPDYDDDGDVDQADFAVLQQCLSGSGQPVTSGCEKADLDLDNDVDSDDLAIFEQCASAPGIAADPNCRE